MDNQHDKGILKRWDDDKGFGFIATGRNAHLSPHFLNPLPTY